MKPQFVPVILGGRRGTTPFTPARLFTSGVAGAWYDSSDYSTLFQDSAGTTPVTAVEQPVGLMLDKSQGLVLGSELVTNGTFTGVPNGTDVTTLSGWSAYGAPTSRNVESNALRIVANAANQGAALTITTVAGRTYQFSCTADVFSAGNIFISGGTPNQPSVAPNPYLFVASGTSVIIYFRGPGNLAGTTNYDNISVRELPGNHASQATAASRPVLRARYNQLTYSEQFDNAVWVLSAATVTANSTTAPDGTTTADTITFSSVAGRVQRAINMASQCISIYVKPIVGTRFAINTDGVSGADATIFNLSGSGSVVSTGANNNSSVITALADGWYRIVTARGSTAGTNIYLGALNSGGGSTDSFYIWGADLRTGSSAGTYQRIAAATDYATAGFLPYLALDGTDDSFGTNSIDFSATDKMFVCTGLTKLSDAVSGTVIDQNGVVGTAAFMMRAPSGALANYVFFSGGTTGFSGAIAAGYAAPTTNVVSGIGNISGDQEILRVNGAQVAISTVDQGTGNYSNLPIYIGRRQGSALPFNGRIYQMVVCGKTLSAAELASTEAYVNSKTGAY